MKQSWRPGTMVYPIPAILVSCGTSTSDCNVFTAAWVGTICSDPAMCYVSIRKERHSHHIIEQTMEFTLNLTNEDLARATDWCGVRSGRDYDKFREMNLTAIEGEKVKAPTIDQSPMSIECRVREIVHLGTHDMFIGEVLNVRADEKYIDPTTGAFDFKKAKLITYCHGEYFKLGDAIGNFGWSVKKKK